ncbi:MAG: dihydroorotate dehydrogenase electron transfer subunit [Christensenellaceae bacterium]|nr:dihydroorotate dehydrogenase electron transfer subunit [Christensenellaceae bacterium]
MKQGIFTIISNECIAKDVYRMELEGDTSAVSAPGQFVNIQLDGFYLRRPISICDYDESCLTLIYKKVGEGTERMSLMSKGEKLDLLTGLGNGYDTSASGEKPLLIGGGVGVPPLYNLCKSLIAEGKTPTVILGYNTSDEVFYQKEFKELGAEVFVTTVDGSLGTKGFVTDVMKKLDYTYFYTCGPMPMFHAIEKTAVTSGQFSFEERMGCGFGACMGCSCKTKYGSKRICKDGPVLEREEIIW